MKVKLYFNNYFWFWVLRFFTEISLLLECEKETAKVLKPSLSSITVITLSCTTQYSSQVHFFGFSNQKSYKSHPRK